MAKKHLVFIFLLVLLIFSTHPKVFAIEPPFVNLKEAMTHGRVAFIGRVIRVDEEHRDEALIKGVAHVQIQKCYYGLDCKSTNVVRIHFILNSILDRYAPVQFHVGEEYLVISNHPFLNNTLIFDSDLEGGVDAAFLVGNTFPEHYYEGRSELSLSDVYWHNSVYKIEKSDLDKWIEGK